MKERFLDYDMPHCWQYDIRINNIEKDLSDSKITSQEVSILRVSDFVFQQEDKNKVFDEVKSFIERHEWLGKMSLYPTHVFTARYRGILSGVVIMDMPASFSKLLGDDTKKFERLISRGACISWSPKNLASSLIMFSIKWMVTNTQYRIFTAYSDSEAKELGTIYQACNFFYIGKKYGATNQYKLENGKWVSDRYFRSRSTYKRLSKENNIEWRDEWQEKDRVLFDRMPIEISEKIRSLSKEYQNRCEKRKINPKHKYVYILGRNKKETKRLRNLFIENNKIFPYPKERGN